MADGRGIHEYRWPVGIVNRLAFIVALVALLLGAEGLASALFFGRQAYLPRASTYSIVLAALAMIFTILLPLVRPLRMRYPRLLATLVLSSAASLFREAAVLLPPAWLTQITVTYYLIFSSAAATAVVALIKAERLDEFLLSLPVALFRALSGTSLGGRPQS